MVTVQIHQQPLRQQILQEALYGFTERQSVPRSTIMLGRPVGCSAELAVPLAAGARHCSNCAKNKNPTAAMCPSRTVGQHASLSAIGLASSCVTARALAPKSCKTNGVRNHHTRHATIVTAALVHARDALKTGMLQWVRYAAHEMPIDDKSVVWPFLDFGHDDWRRSWRTTSASHPTRTQCSKRSRRWAI
jgi:hypothetical protein